jgi:2-dehydropantoate 2-reductase
MKIAIIGAGGVGGYLGGVLARAGHAVAFLARGAQLEALRRHGLRVRSPHGDFALEAVQATDRPAEIGPVDLALVTVKAYDLDRAGEMMRPLVGPGTAVLPLQNGVESAARLAECLPPETLLGGAIWIVAAVAEPGVIQQSSPFRRLVIGELDGRLTPRLAAVHTALREAGLEAETSDNIRKVLWAKLLFIASFSGLSSVTRAPAGPIMAAPEARGLLRRAMEEVAAAAAGDGVPLDANVVDDNLAFCARMSPDTTPSMQRDVVAGRRLEYDAINGAVVRAGRRAGVPTPVHEFFWTCLQVVDEAARGARA